MPDATTSEQLDAIVALQHEAFHAEGPPPAPVRRERLARTYAMLDARRDEIVDALSADYGHRSRDLTLIADLAGTLSSLKDAHDNVESWMRAERHDGFVDGAEGRLERVPVGVVGIIGLGTSRSTCSSALSPACSRRGTGPS